MEPRENTNKHGKYTSIAITLAVIFMLILSGPAGAVTVGITGLSGTQTAYGTPVSFVVDITIDDPDTYVPISNLSLDITGPINAEYGFSLDGSAIVTNDNITVTPISVPTNAYGNGYGYGVDNAYGYGYDFGYGYGYGYNNGAGGGPITYSYSVTFTNFPSGDYNVIANLNTGESSHPSFSSSPASFKVLPITTGTLNGVVKNPSGTPVSGATISVDGTTRNITDSNGYYQITNLALSSHTVAASKVNYSENSTAVSITGINTQNFTLTPTQATITGTVVDDVGNAIENAEIEINTTSPTIVHTNVYGEYTARVLVEDISVFNLTASASDHEQVSNITSMSIAQVKGGMNFILNRSKADLELASGEYAVKFAENTTNATFALNIRNYGSTAQFAVDNSSTSATVVINETAPTVVESGITTILVNISSTNVGAYPVTISVTNSTQVKSATIDLVAIMTCPTVAYNDTSSTIDSENVGNGSVVVEDSNVLANATLTNASVFSNSTISGVDAIVEDSVVKDNSTVTNATVEANSIVSSSNVTAGATVTTGSVVEGSNITGTTTIVTNATLTSVIVTDSTVTGVTLSNVTLEDATVVASGGEAMITAGNITTEEGVVFLNVYEDTLVDELVIEQSLNNVVNTTSPIVNSIDSTGTYLNLTATGAGNVSVSQCSISPGGAFALTTDEEVVGDFFQFNFTGSMTDAWVRMYIDTATKEEYDATDKTLSVVYHNVTTGELESHDTSDPTWDSNVGQWYVEFYTTHFSTFALIGTTTTTIESTTTTEDTTSSTRTSTPASIEPYENIAVKDIVSLYVNLGSNIKYEFKEDENPISFVSFDAKTNAGYVIAKIEVLNDMSSLVSSLPTGEIYKHINIWIGNAGYATDNNIANPVIEFKVAKSWISDNDIDESTIKLNRYNSDKWNPLLTTKTNEDVNYIYFKSETPGFSPFAITGDVTSSSAVVEDDEPTVEKVDESTIETTNVPQEEDESNSKIVLAIVAIGILIVGVLIYLRRRT